MSGDLREIAPRRRRGAAVVALLASALLLVAGCSSGDSTAGGSEGASTGSGGDGAASGNLTIFWDTSSKAGLEAVISDFKAANPGVEVTVTYASGDNQAVALRTSLAAGNGADVMIVYPGTGTANGVVALAQAGYVADLSDEPWVKELPSALVENAKDDQGRVVSMPLAYFSFGAAYNNEALAASGLSIPTTFSEALQFCKDAAAKGKVGYALGTTVQVLGQFIPSALMAQLVYGPDPDVDKKLADGSTTFDKTGWRDVFERFVDMADAGCFPEGFAGMDAATTDAMWAKGDALSQITVSREISLVTNYPATYTLTGFPGSDDPDETRMTVSAEDSAAVNAAGNVELAKKFLTFFETPEMLRKYVDILSGVSDPDANRGMLPVLVNDSTKTTDQYSTTMQQFVDSGKSSAAMFDYSWPNPDVLLVLRQDVPGMLQGSVSVDQILSDMQKAYDEGPAGQ